MNVNKIILEFASFLNKGYPGLLQFSREVEKQDPVKAEIIETGFLQFIWELIVESSVCKKDEFLEIYGDGADFDEIYSRVTSIQSQPTHRIFVRTNNDLDLISNTRCTFRRIEFLKLVSFENGCYYTEPTFDAVLCENELGDKFVFQLNEVEFILEPI